jgi:hypothetical protein
MAGPYPEQCRVMRGTPIRCEIPRNLANVSYRYECCRSGWEKAQTALRGFLWVQLDTNKIDIFDFRNTAAATSPKNSTSPGRRLTPITMRL